MILHLKIKENKKRSEIKTNEYSNIYSIIDKINLTGITYRSKYENIDDKEKGKANKEEMIKKIDNKNKKLKNISKLVISKVKKEEKNNNNVTEKKSKQIMA